MARAARQRRENELPYICLLYTSAADIVVETDGKSELEICEEPVSYTHLIGSSKKGRCHDRKSKL